VQQSGPIGWFQSHWLTSLRTKMGRCSHQEVDVLLRVWKDKREDRIFSTVEPMERHKQMQRKDRRGDLCNSVHASSAILVKQFGPKEWWEVGWMISDHQCVNYMFLFHVTVAIYKVWLRLTYLRHMNLVFMTA
jgi:hypothetical protein